MSVRKEVAFQKVLASARQLPLQDQLRLLGEMLRELEIALAREEGTAIPRRPLYGL